MRRRNVEKETVEIDVLQKKNEELKQFVERYDSAVAVVTGTINNSKSVPKEPVDQSQQRFRSIFSQV